MTAPRLIIATDLDGTLCDHSRRAHFIAAREWDAYHADLINDPPHDDVLWLLTNLASARVMIVAVTARPEKHRISTERWIVKHNVPISAVLMRGNDDYRADHEVKIEALSVWCEENFKTEGIKPQHRVLFVLDDKDSVVEAWRNAGFNCWQVRHGGL